MQTSEQWNLSKICENMVLLRVYLILVKNDYEKQTFVCDVASFVSLKWSLQLYTWHSWHILDIDLTYTGWC